MIAPFSAGGQLPNRPIWISCISNWQKKIKHTVIKILISGRSCLNLISRPTFVKIITAAYVLRLKYLRPCGLPYQRVVSWKVGWILKLTLSYSSVCYQMVQWAWFFRISSIVRITYLGIIRNINSQFTIRYTLLSGKIKIKYYKL